jgi:hypothetical protein
MSKIGKKVKKIFFPSNFKIDDEEGPLLFSLVEQHFEKVQKLKTESNSTINQNSVTTSTACTNQKTTNTSNPPFRRPSLIPIVKRNTVIKELLEESNSLIHLEDASAAETKSNNTDEIRSIESDDESFKYRLARRTLSGSRKLSLQQSLNIPREVINNVKSSEAFLKRILPIEEESIKLCPRIHGRIRLVKS